MDQIFKRSNKKIRDLADLTDPNLFNHIFYHHTDLIFIMKVEKGPRFRYFYVNKIGMKYANLSEDKLDKYMDEVLDEKTFNHLNHYYLKALRSKDPVIFIDEVIINNETKRMFESQLTVINKDLSTYIVCVTRDIHSNRLERIKYFELHDQLTGTWNRIALMEHLEGEVNKASKKQREFSVIHLDLDRFKLINDSLGHQAGDEMLQFISARLMKWAKGKGKIYRLGGNGFIVLVSNTNREEIEEYAKQLLSLFERPFTMGNDDYYISLSIGISMYPVDGEDADTLLKNAYSALFLVKEKGGAHYRFYRSWMTGAFPNYILMESHLRKAIDKKEFQLHYQPQVKLETGKIESFEALLRWNNRKYGKVSPAHFIPIAEHSGLIISIGEWVIKEVCRQIAEWRDRGFKHIRVAVNISPRQFMETNLPDVIKEALNQYQLPASCLEIEITEGAMQDTEAALTMLQRLKEMGLVISVDDFGTGYSSLNYLKKFPIDILKIDQSFVQEIMLGSKDAAITKAIIQIAHSLNLEVVAEGVEEQVQVDFLIKANCQKAQGFFYSKPINAEEIEKRILNV